MTKIPVSILITYFNEGPMLKECIESILHSNLVPNEIIIYDDCAEVAAQNFIPDHGTTTPISVIREAQNRGPGYGRNKLLALATSDYVHFHDADDLFEPNWCATILAQIQRQQPDVLVAAVKTYREDVLVTEDVMSIGVLNEPIDLIKLGLQGAILPVSTVFKRELALSVGGYEPREVLAQSEDFHFHIKLGLSNPKVCLIKEPLVIQRLRQNSNSSTAGLLVCYQSAYRALELLKQELYTIYQEDLANAYARIGHVLFVLGDKQMAKQAFKASKALYKIDFKNRSKWFQIVARVCGIFPAEYISLVVQKIKNHIVFTSRI